MFDDESRRELPVGRIAAVVAVVAVLLVAGGLGAFIIRSLSGSGQTTQTIAGARAPQASPPAARGSSPAASPAGSPRPSPGGGVPTYAPLSQGTVKSVQLAFLNGDCTSGSGCALETTVNFSAAQAPVDYAWTLKVYDPCTTTTTDAGTAHVTAQKGWNHVIGDRTVTLPTAKGMLYIVAVTTSPDQAASPPLAVGQGGC